MTATMKKSLLAALATGVLAVGLIAPALAQDSSDEATATEQEEATTSDDTVTDDADAIDDTGEVPDEDCHEGRGPRGPRGDEAADAGDADTGATTEDVSDTV